MGFIAWIIFGIVAGFIASRIVNKQGEGFVVDMILGIIGAVVGGFLFTTFGFAPVTGFNFYSLIVAIIGAVAVLFLYHAVVGRRTTI
jgi:uncharacterized membrane protein YeaQ/YmgE (transglycosylase-associated protein family)